ncbi:MAG: hypothetical protein QOI83_4321, partial [Streptomycetaceae bacterium]|nr:hypothetical protein [Streptomycetaceae bacterium]
MAVGLAQGVPKAGNAHRQAPLRPGGRLSAGQKWPRRCTCVGLGPKQAGNDLVLVGRDANRLRSRPTNSAARTGYRSISGMFAFRLRRVVKLLGRFALRERDRPAERGQLGGYEPQARGVFRSARMMCCSAS